MITKSLLGIPLLAIDGKTLRGAVNQHGANNALHLISAFDTEQGFVLYQQDTQTKGNEIATVQALPPFIK